MGASQKRRPLARRVGELWPAWSAEAVDRVIRAGEILVDGRVLANPGARITADAAIRHVTPNPLAGGRKLAWALARFGVDASGRDVLDVGASTGGFTEAWLAAGAARVHAVDVGHGQLRGSLRQDPRVVVLERTKVGDLTPLLIPSTLDAVSVDVSYLSLSSAVEQLSRLSFATGAALLGLVKPMFELRLATIPSRLEVLEQARDVAVAGVGASGWRVVAADECPIRGGRGAVEFFVHAVHP